MSKNRPQVPLTAALLAALLILPPGSVALAQVSAPAPQSSSDTTSQVKVLDGQAQLAMLHGTQVTAQRNTERGAGAIIAPAKTPLPSDPNKPWAHPY